MDPVSPILPGTDPAKRIGPVLWVAAGVGLAINAQRSSPVFFPCRLDANGILPYDG
jgi:hypothetical protein